mgnify:CR=1 FL=1
MYSYLCCIAAASWVVWSVRYVWTTTSMSMSYTESRNESSISSILDSIRVQHQLIRRRQFQGSGLCTFDRIIPTDQLFKRAAAFPLQVFIFTTVLSNFLHCPSFCNQVYRTLVWIIINKWWRNKFRLPNNSLAAGKALLSCSPSVTARPE